MAVNIDLLPKDGSSGSIRLQDIAKADVLLEKGEMMLDDLRTGPNHWPQKREAIFLFVRHYNFEDLLSVKQQDGSIMPYHTAVKSMGAIVELHKQFPLEIIGNLLTGDHEITLGANAKAKPETVFECSVLVLSNILAAERKIDPTNALRLLADDCYRVFCPLIAYGEAQKISAQIGEIKASLSKESKAALAAFQKTGAEQISKITESTDKLAKCASDAEVKIEKIIADISPEIQQQAQFFRDEANEHKSQAICWLIAIVSMLALLGSAGYWTIQNPIDFGDNDNISLIAQAIFGRAIIFGALGSAIFMCARNYRSHRHNAVVNKHRENALKTYQAFLKEAEESKDPATKAIVLNYAAKCIYAPQETGYDKIGGGKDVSIDMHRILGKTDGE